MRTGSTGVKLRHSLKLLTASLRICLLNACTEHLWQKLGNLLSNMFSHGQDPKGKGLILSKQSLEVGLAVFDSFAARKFMQPEGAGRISFTKLSHHCPHCLKRQVADQRLARIFGDLFEIHAVDPKGVKG